MPQEVAPPPMTPAHIPDSAPKRFSAGRRSLYTDPFAEMQGSSPVETLPDHESSAKRTSLLPPTIGSFNSFESSPFPVGESPFPVGETNEEHLVQPVVTHETYEYSEQVNGHMETFKTEVDTVRDDHGYHQEIRNEFFTDEGGQDSTHLYPSEPHQYHQETVQPSTDDMMIPRQHSTSMIPVVSPRQSPPGSELRAIATGVDTVFSNSMDETGEMRAETVLLPRNSQEEEEWFNDQHQPQLDNPMSNNESGVETSFLGHPVVAEQQRSFDEFSAVLEGIKSTGDQTSIVAVQTAIVNCLDLVRENPTNRVLFCEAIEAVTFNDGPLREAARDAVPVLVDLLEESSLGDMDDHINVSTTSSALGALWNLTLKATEDMSVVELISLAKRAMESFPDDGAVQTNGSGLLVNLAVDRNGQRNLLNLGCLDALVAAVQKHPENDTLIEHTCQLLSMIASRKDLKTLLPKSQCKTVSDIAQSRSDPSVRRWGGWLKNLTGV